MTHAERLQGRGREARRVALVADEDHLEVVRRDVEPAVGRRVQPPLEHIAVDDERAREPTFAVPVDLGADVDQDGSSLLRDEGLAWSDAAKVTACVVEELVDGPHGSRGHRLPSPSGSLVTTVRDGTRPRSASAS